MKAKVLNRFIDKNTNDLQEIGTEIEVTQKRFEEINSTVHGILLEEVKTKKKTTKK